MALLASTIIDSLRQTLIDPAPGATWDDARYLALINEAERAIIAVRPDAYPVRGTLALAAGTKQTLPAGGLCLMDVYANTASGRRATLVNRELQDAAAVFFPAATPEKDVQHYMPDARDPTRFDVVPPNDGTGSVEILYGAVPVPIANVSSAINLPDTFERPIIAFVLSRCYREKTPTQNLAAAEVWDAEWQRAVGLGSQSQAAVAPRAAAGKGG